METVVLTGLSCVSGHIRTDVHSFLSMNWNLYQAFNFSPHFHLSALRMKRTRRYFRELTRTLK